MPRNTAREVLLFSFLFDRLDLISSSVILFFRVLSWFDVVQKKIASNLLLENARKIPRYDYDDKLIQVQVAAYCKNSMVVLPVFGRLYSCLSFKIEASSNLYSFLYWNFTRLKSRTSHSEWSSRSGRFSWKRWQKFRTLMKVINSCRALTALVMSLIFSGSDELWQLLNLEGRFNLNYMLVSPCFGRIFTLCFLGAIQ
jgi:hypothetical protein